jgi:hypothetical protein
MAKTFDCFNQHSSEFIRRRRKTDFSGARLVGVDPSTKETRTYECSVCGAENDITLSPGEWLLIDGWGLLR